MTPAATLLLPIMPAHHISVRRRWWVAFALACTLAPLTPAVLVAQMGGGGGGRGGAAGGRGGGMGGGGSMGGGSAKSPAAMAKERIKKADPIEFLLDRKKPLELTNEQQDVFKSLRKEMQRTQAPLFKDLDKLFGDMPQRGGSPPGGGMGGGMGGGRGGGMGGGGRPGEDRPNGGTPGSGAPGAGASDTVRAVLGTLSDIQDSFRDRAREQLTAVQRTRADSLQQVMLAEERAKSEKERDKRQQRR